MFARDTFFVKVRDSIGNAGELDLELNEWVRNTRIETWAYVLNAAAIAAAVASPLVLGRDS